MGSSILNHLRGHPGWPDVETIIAKLTGKGFEAVLAGGCVRDALIGRGINDFDIATSATPDQVEKIFPRSVAVGKAFGVIKVIVGHGAYDVATFRNDGEYADGRRPLSVRFSGLAEDARRRDFTVNALFYSPASDQVIDVVGGLDDIKKRIIRTVGRAADRFNEDSLRALRAVRFAAQLGFEVDGETWDAVKAHSPRTARLARERQAEELRKLSAASGAAKGWEMLRDSGLLGVIFPDLEKKVAAVPRLWHVALRALAVGSHWPLPVTLGWFGRVFSFDPRTVGGWLESLKASASERAQATEITKGLVDLKNRSLVARLKTLDGPNGPWLVKLWPFAELPLTDEKTALINGTLEAFKGRMDVTGHLPLPRIRGEDLKSIGLSPGPEMGRWMQRAYDYQLANPDLNKSDLLNWLRNEIS